MDNKTCPHYKKCKYNTKCKKKGGNRMAVSMGAIPLIKGDAADELLSQLNKSKLNIELIKECEQLFEKISKEEE